MVVSDMSRHFVEREDAHSHNQATIRTGPSEAGMGHIAAILEDIEETCLFSQHLNVAHLKDFRP